MPYSERHQFPRPLKISPDARAFFECNPEDEVTTQRGTDTPVAASGKAASSKYYTKSGLSPREQLERQLEFHSSTQHEA